jgi:predicted nuclease with TOPRIM domain
MSETLDLGLLGRRVEITQNEVHDVLRRVIALAGRFDSHETRMGSLEGRMAAIESRMASLEGRMSVMESRLDHLADRMSKLEEQNAVALFILRKLAAQSGIEVPT